MLYRRADLFIFKSFLYHKQNVTAIAMTFVLIPSIELQQNIKV
jgi:hypothetical protein